MTSPGFQPAFEAAVSGSGRAYVEARELVLGELREDLRAAIDGGAPGGGEAGEATLAMLALWADAPELCERVARYARGEMPEHGAPPSILGEWPPTDRARAITALGPAALPRVLELLWKTPGLGVRGAEAALFLAVEGWADRRATPVMLELLERGEDPGSRARAAEVLGVLDGDAARTALRRALSDDAAPSPVRRAAARSLGRVRDRQAAPALLALVESSPDGGLRTDAVSALAGAAPELAAPALAALVGRVDSDELDLRMMSELAGIGDQQALDRLDELAAEHRDRAMREEAARAARRLRARLGSR